jgi:hypothetical protein
VQRCACARETVTLQNQCFELLLSIYFDTYTCYILYTSIFLSKIFGIQLKTHEYMVGLPMHGRSR